MRKPATLPIIMHEDVSPPESSQGKQNKTPEDALDTPQLFKKSKKRLRKLVFGVGKGPNQPIPRAKEIVQEPEQKTRAVFVEKVMGRGKRRICFKFPEVNKQLLLTAPTSKVVSSLLEHANCIYPAEVILARSLSSDTSKDTNNAEEQDDMAAATYFEEDSKVEAKRILTAISKTFRTLRKNLSELSHEKSFEYLFPAEYGFYFFNSPEVPLVLDDQAKMVSFIAQGVKF